MSTAAVRLPTRVLRAQVLLGMMLFGTLTAFGPELLLLDDEIGRASGKFALMMVMPLAAAGYALTWVRLRKNRYVLRALALGSAAVEPDDIARLSSLPAYVATVFVALVASAVLLFMLPPFRPALLDFNTAFSLALLGLIIVAAAALPLYVAVRTAVSHALELANPDAMAELLGQAEASESAKKRLEWRLLIAIATPVGFVAVGASLVAHAHVRKFDSQSREQTAEIVARVALEAAPGAVDEAGRAEAIDAARNLGFTLRPERETLKFSVERGDDGRVSLTTPLEEGAANIRFKLSAVGPVTAADVGIAVLALGLAAALGLALGRSLSRDIAQATHRVRLLGTDEVLRGDEPALAPARYAQVAALNRAIDTLAARFRVFAHAQERAIEARDAARKLRSLLFASVSHDLRSPLNSILGFAGLVKQKPLSAAQRESLGFIEQSGRELLALIETILDMSKIEAGKMVLARQDLTMGGLVAEALRRSRLLAAARPLEFDVDIEDGLPHLVGDESRLAQAISAIIWYSARSGEPVLSPEGTVRPIDLKVQWRENRSGEKTIAIGIEAPQNSIPPEELERLLSPDPWAAGRRRYGALALGLGLARSLVELHRGTLKVKRTERGTPLFEVALPVP
jgi:signal transduction histidine kinase